PAGVKHRPVFRPPLSRRHAIGGAMHVLGDADAGGGVGRGRRFSRLVQRVVGGAGQGGMSGKRREGELRNGRNGRERRFPASPGDPAGRTSR
ncbi:MAG: hypothetical protein AAF907_07290, partial [Planctomycetota bacterium]